MQIITLLSEQQAVFITACFVLGLLLGSFLNVVILRLPAMMQKDWHQQCSELLEIESQQDDKETPFNLVTPRSCCPKCGHKITSLENIPVISYIILRGKCASCKTHISAQYPTIEAVTAILSVAVALKFGVSAETFWGLLFTWALVSLTMIDAKTQLLPDNITLPLLWLGILVNTSGVFTDLESSVFGAMVGYLILWSIYKLFKAITGKEGMGYGDFKLLAALGAWMGWQMLPQIILLSSLVGAAIGIAMIAFTRHNKNIPIPFGPYLAIAGWIAFMWGQDINRLWLNI